VFEQSRGGRSKRTEGSAGDESLEVPQTQGARFIVLPGKGFGVLHELLEGQAALPDALFEQCSRLSIGQPCSLPPCGACLWHPDGERRSFR
jgi:hypothetical protein